MERRVYVKPVIVAVSGGADSVYLMHQHGLAGGETLIAHVNHGARGRDSDDDMRFVETIAKNKNLAVRVKRVLKKGAAMSAAPGFEERARDLRYSFLKELKAATGAKSILLAHTADDQVETLLMRVFEGAGIAGLKGIPRKTSDGIERPLLDTWREDILKYLHKHDIPYRIDKSNFNTRFERNWIRHVLIPLLEKRYGKSLKKRIFTLGERFREIDEFLETAARRWMKWNLKGTDKGKKGTAGGKPIGGGRLRFSRKSTEKLPSALRKKILQIVCFEGVGIAPNERLLESMDRLIVSGGASARLNVGKGAVLKCRYDHAIVDMTGMNARTTGEKGRDTGTRAVKSAFKGKRLQLEMNGPGRYEIDEIVWEGAIPRAGGPVGIRWEEKGRVPQSGLKRLAKGERAAAIERGEILLPLSVRPLRSGDRIRPFGLTVDKKVKEILIDRKVPREERWGRPVVCDAEGRILWIPGVIRSAHAPVTGKTRRMVVLRLEIRDFLRQ